jgi:polypeptide N-acetylgalactosaminyltransferase
MKRNLLKLTKLLIISTLLFLLLVVFIKSISDTSSFNELLPSSPQRHVAEKRQPPHPKVGAFFGGNRNQHARRIDWHDYEQIKRDGERVGFGEHGTAVNLDETEKGMEDSFFHQNGFNALLSDKISINRSVPDIRHPKCKDKVYLSELPSVSVIVPFYNEHWSTLLRTIYSVLNRSPSDLLTEIILVDDYSQKEFLKGKLDRYVQEHLPKVKIIRMKERGGLVTARLAGARAAYGDVLVFLDSHTEANVNWLPPLLEPIAENYRTCVCPFIDVVAYDTFEYRAQDEGARGAFDWQLFYKRLPLTKHDLEHPTEPFDSPIMAGGLFAISSKFFWELGGYDEGLEIWGGEQYELSFKIWQCHGRMVDAPCSRVGHIYRKFASFDSGGKGDYLTRNHKRVVEVWMDSPYKEYIYNKSPRYKTVDPGDLTKQRAIRESLQCKSFAWFMTEVAFDLMDK